VLESASSATDLDLISYLRSIPVGEAFSTGVALTRLSSLSPGRSILRSSSSAIPAMENKEIKDGRLPEGWDVNPDCLQQKDLDARWTKKNGLSYYGYKNSICIDVDHGFIRRYAVTPANIHDSQMLPLLLDLKNEHDYVWADSAYSGECFDDLLSLGGFESLIHEKGARNHPLSDAAKELNRVKSSIRACVDHVFGCMTMSMGGKLTRKIGLERNEAWWGLKSPTFNFLRFLQRSAHLAVVA
jgi:IS5 family transposase